MSGKLTWLGHICSKGNEHVGLFVWFCMKESCWSCIAPFNPGFDPFVGLSPPPDPPESDDVVFGERQNFFRRDTDSRLFSCFWNCESKNHFFSSINNWLKYIADIFPIIQPKIDFYGNTSLSFLIFYLIHLKFILNQQLWLSIFYKVLFLLFKWKFLVWHFCQLWLILIFKKENRPS